MASIYEKIKTAAELVQEVKAHYLSTAQEDICRAQDIFGHSSVKELRELAKESQDTFYLILFKIWNWRDAIAFYNKHSNPDNIDEIKADLKKQTRLFEEAKSSLNQINGALTNEMARTGNLRAELQKEKDKKSALESENIRLKAKLYDLVVGGDK